MLSDHMHQDIARSSYADMLNDDERNRAYNNAIEFSVTYLVTSKTSNADGNRFFKCCDIGTGSGLLSMMIVRAFKRLNYNRFHVQAFEAFQPMADCAKKVIEQNDMSEHITVIPTRSDAKEFAENPQFDLLVAELLDTELIGEGCLGAYRHAVQNLCSPDCLFVPHGARIYLEPVASARLFSRHAIDDLSFKMPSGGQVLEVSVGGEVKDCPGMPEIDDMQVSALREDEDFTRFTKPQRVFEFTFGQLESLKLSDYKQLTFTVERKIYEPPVAIMWWDILMYDSSLQSKMDTTMISSPAATDATDKQYSWEVLSCAPNWARSTSQLARDQFIRETYGRDVWREHWIQGVYYFASVPETRSLVESPVAASGSQPTLTIHAYHDGYSLWFDLKQCKSKLPNNCDCGVHRKLTRSQLAFLSDPSQMTDLLQSSLPSIVHQSSAASNAAGSNLEARIEFRQQDESLGDTVMLSSGNDPKWRIICQLNPTTPATDCCELTSPMIIDLALAGEIPWSHIMISYLDKGKPPEPVESFEIKFTQVQFDNLNRIRTNIRDCEGFNLSDLDDMINYSSKYVDKELEAHYLWEYPCVRLDPTDYTVFSSLAPSLNSSGSSSSNQSDKINSGTYWRDFRLPISQLRHDVDETSAACSWQKGWALAFWVELRLRHTGRVLSLGPVNGHKSLLGERIEWTRNCKQLVYFLHDHPLIAPQTSLMARASNSNSSNQQQQQAELMPSIHLDVGLSKCQLMVQRAVDYNTSPLKSKRRLD